MKRTYFHISFWFVNGLGMSAQEETIGDVLKIIKANDHEGCSWSVYRIEEEDFTDKIQEVYVK